MSENEKTVNVHWHVRIAGVEEELLVYAAYVQYHDATATKTARAIGSSEPMLATFKNADHKVILQVLAAALVYVRRADVTGTIDKNAPPSQVRDLQEELRQAAEPVECFNCAEAGEPGAVYPPEGAGRWPCGCRVDTPYSCHGPQEPVHG